MIRITFHLKGVQKQQVSYKVTDKETGRYEWMKKEKLFNTIAQKVKNESEGLAFMNNFVEDNDGVEVTNYYFSNC